MPRYVLEHCFSVCVSVGAFPEEISIWAGGLCRADFLPQCEWASSNLLRAWIEQNVEEKWICSLCVSWDTYILLPYNRVSSSWLLRGGVTHYSCDIDAPGFQILGFLGLQTWSGIYTIGCHDSQGFRLGLNSTTGFPDCPCCRWQVTGLLVSIVMCTNSYTKSPSVYVYTYHLFLWRTLIRPLLPTPHQLLITSLYFCTSQWPLLQSALVLGQGTQPWHRIPSTATVWRAEYAELSEGFCWSTGLSLGTEVEDSLWFQLPNTHLIFISRKALLFFCFVFWKKSMTCKWQLLIWRFKYEWTSRGSITLKKVDVYRYQCRHLQKVVFAKLEQGSSTGTGLFLSRGWIFSLALPTLATHRWFWQQWVLIYNI